MVGLLIMPMISKTMGAAGYGIWSQVTATVSLIISFTNLGLGAALVRFLAAEKRREDIREAFYSVILTLFAVNCAVAAMVIIFANPLAANFFNGAVQVVRLTGVIVILVTLVENYLLLYRTFQQVKLASVFMAAETCLFTGLIAFFVFRGYGIVFVVLAFIIVKTLEFIVLFFMVKIKLGIKWPRFSRLKEFLGFGLPLAPRGLAYWLINISDRYTISYFLGATSLGIYAAGYNLGNIPYLITMILTYILMATLPQLYDDGKINEVKTHLRYNLKYFMAISVPFLFGGFVIGESVLRLFSTEEIASKGHVIVPLVTLSVTILSLHNIIYNILLLVKKVKILVYTWIIAAVLDICLNLLLIPRIGIIGGAISALCAYTLALAVVGYYAFREFTFPIDWLFILKSILASLVMSVAIWPLRSTGLLGTFFVVIAGVAVYGVVLVLLKGFSRSEFNFFWGLLKRQPK